MSETQPSRLFTTRDVERFYDYPPVLGDLQPEDVWRREAFNLYVNIPFCLKFCNYCPYFKHRYERRLVSTYVPAVLAEARLLGPRLAGRSVNAVYIGGGTPSCLSPDQIAALLAELRRSFAVDEATQVTMEFNPATTTPEKLASARENGVTRTSFGVQSFNNDMLRLLGRVHDGDRARKAVTWAREAGFEHINIDLLFRTPGQTVAAFLRDVEAALDLGVDHLTAFGLNVKPHTNLYDRKDALPPVPDLETEVNMLDALDSAAAERGFRRYSIDCLARGEPNRYETFELEVVGIGAGAFSHINRAVYHNLLDVPAYLETLAQGRQPLQLGKRLSPREEMERYCSISVYMLGLRETNFRARFGVSISEAFPHVRELVDDGLLEAGQDGYVVTRRGLLYIFNISKSFFDPWMRELLALSER